MPDKKKRGRKNKDAQLIIRISKEERKAFVDLCEDLDTTAAREIRHFIRRFVGENGGQLDAGDEAPASEA
jgi:hypothetical protein